MAEALIGLQAALRKTSQLTDAVMREQQKAIKGALMIIERNAKSNVKKLAEYDHGALANRISHRVTTKTQGEVGYIGAPMYAIWFEFGTGIRGKQGIHRAIPGETSESYKLAPTPPRFAPSGQLIVPKHGKFLVWRDRETGETIFAKQTKGMAPRPALRGAMIQSKDEVIKFLKDYNTASAKQILRALSP